MLHKRSVYLAAGAFAGAVALSMAETTGAPSPSTTDDHTKTQGSFLQGFIASLSVVIVSELGDKTFFIAAIMAMKHARLIVFAGAISALVFMTVLSALFGSIATIIPRVYTYYISAVLFAIFGIKMLRDGCKMDPNEGQEELEEVQMELKRREDAAKEKDRSRSQSPDSKTESPSAVSSPNGALPSDAVSLRSGASQSGASHSEGSQVAGPSQPPPDEAPGPPVTLRVILRLYAWQYE